MRAGRIRSTAMSSLARLARRVCVIVPVRTVSGSPGRSVRLVALMVAVYSTSFLRERYLLQEALGGPPLDHAVAAYGVAAMIGNVWAGVLGMAWIDGRVNGKQWYRQLLPVFVVGGVLLPIQPAIGVTIVLAGLVGAFEYNRQRAAFVGRQAVALTAALVAPAVSMGVWALVGFGSITRILAGYAGGFVVQGCVASLSGSGASGGLAQEGRSGRGIGWLIVFGLVTQVNGLVDRVLLLPFGTGWSGAGAFSMNVVAAIILVVVAPLSSEAIAGRVVPEPSRRVVTLVVLGSLVIALCLPTVLPTIVGASVVEGSSYGKLRALLTIYMLAVPAFGYWLFCARVLQRTSLTWRPLAKASVWMLVVHLVVAVPGVAMRQPLAPAIGWTVAAYLGAFGLVSRGVAVRRHLSLLRGRLVRLK